MRCWPSVKQLFGDWTVAAGNTAMSLSNVGQAGVIIRMSLRNCVQKLLSVLGGRNAIGTWIGLALSVLNAGHGLLRSRRTVKARWDA